MPHVDAQEVLDKLAALGPYDGSPEKQLYRTSLNGFTTRLVHPTAMTAVDADGNPVNSDENIEIPGRRFIPKLVDLPAQYTDNYVAKGFKVPAPAAPVESETLPFGTDPELEALSKEELILRAQSEGVPAVIGERTSVIIGRILASRGEHSEPSPTSKSRPSSSAKHPTPA